MYKDYVVSCSLGNYLNADGGVSKVIRAHQEMLKGKHISYVFLFPVRKEIGRFVIHGWGFMIDAEFIGIFCCDGIRKKLSDIQAQGYNCRQIHLHHLKKVDLDELQQIIDVYNCEIKFYLHDYFAVCKQGNLLQNGKFYCGEENGICKNNCCEYYDETYVKKHLNFFLKNEKRMEYIAPSDAVKMYWGRLAEVENENIRVVWHQTLKGNYIKKKKTFERKIRIAYIGTQTVNKGWQEWKKMLDELSDLNYSFYYFGNGTERLSNVTNIEVSVKKDGDMAMLQALRREDIDVVYLGSICPETYSYAYYETFAANCFVLAYAMSGNIADAVKKNTNGKIFGDTTEMLSYLKDEAVLKVDLQRWNESDVLGPLDLEENREMLEVVASGKGNTKKVSNQFKWHLHYRKILLETVYRIRKM